MTQPQDPAITAAINAEVQRVFTQFMTWYTDFHRINYRAPYPEEAYWYLDDPYRASREVSMPPGWVKP